MYTPVGFKYLGASIMLNDSNSAQLINNKIFNSADRCNTVFMYNLKFPNYVAPEAVIGAETIIEEGNPYFHLGGACDESISVDVFK